MLVKRTLILGDTGNLGLACTKVLLDANWEVVGLSRHAYPDLPKRKNLEHFILTGLPGGGAARFLDGQMIFDLVIFAQGMTMLKHIADLNTWDWEAVRQANLDLCVHWTHLLSMGHLAQDGLIIYISSIQATHPRRQRLAYATTKAAIEGLTRAAAADLAPYNRTVCLRLGQLTKQMQGIVFDPQQLDTMKSRACRPWIEPEEVARFILALYNQPGMTGAVLDFDSGQNLNIWP